VTIRGTAYLLTRGATYNHDWRLRVALPANLTGTLSCTTFLDPTDEYRFRDCNRTGPEPVKGALDVLVFSRTREIFADTNGQAFTNTLPGQGFIQGPKSVFRVDFDTPVAASSISAAPFDPYLHVLSTGAKIQLLQVNPQFKDSNGFPFGLLMPSNWLPPLEYIGLSTAYPMFDSFVSSEATQYRNWYESVMTSHVIPQAPSSVWAW
jgi:hypothetical protein